MLSYYVIYYEKLKIFMQRTDIEALTEYYGVTDQSVNFVNSQTMIYMCDVKHSFCILAQLSIFTSTIWLFYNIWLHCILAVFYPYKCQLSGESHH